MNQFQSLRSQAACTPFTALSITVPLPIPETMQQIGPEISSVFKRLIAPSQVDSYQRTFRTSQADGIELSFKMLIKSSQKCRVNLVSQVIVQAPCLVDVKAIAIPTILSTVNNFSPFLQYSIVTCILEINYHISKSIFLPWITFPSEFLTKMLEQALKVENSYMKLRKNSLSKGRPLN